MRIALITMAALVGRGASASQINNSARQTVTVCMPTGVDPRLDLAQATTSKLFGVIGVRLDWRQHQRSCAPGAILVSLASRTQQNSHPGALALALPNEGPQIQVFYNRVRERVEAHRAPFVLAYILAHEITHILQGLERHSNTGIMKAKWEPEDFNQMSSMRLAFTKEDVNLIRLGLANRSAPMAAIPEVR